MRLARFAQRPITQQACAKQRRGLDIVVMIGQPKTKPCVGDGKLGITAIDGVAGETRVVAKIFAVGPTISAFPICPAKPRNANAIADGEFFNTFADLFDAPDNLMPGNQRQLRLWQLSIDNMEISPTNRTGTHANEQLSRSRVWPWHIAELQRLPRIIENHRAHVDEYKMTNDEARKKK